MPKHLSHGVTAIYTDTWVEIVHTASHCVYDFRHGR